jgi:hypothetical protein
VTTNAADGLSQLLAEAVRQLAQTHSRADSLRRGAIGGICGPVTRPLTGGPWLAARMDTELIRIGQEVIALAKARMAVTFGDVTVQDEVAQALTQMLSSGATIEPGQETERAALNISQRLALLLMVIVQFGILRSYHDLSAYDFGFLSLAIAILVPAPVMGRWVVGKFK